MEVIEMLETMRKEQREDHITLAKKVDDGFATIEARATKIAEDLVEHEKADLVAHGETNSRLQPLESLNKSAKWLVGTVIGAFIMVGAAGLWDFFANHLHGAGR